jgi:hypothetical protein
VESRCAVVAGPKDQQQSIWILLQRRQLSLLGGLLSLRGMNRFPCGPHCHNRLVSQENKKETKSTDSITRAEVTWVSSITGREMRCLHLSFDILFNLSQCFASCYLVGGSTVVLYRYLTVSVRYRYRYRRFIHPCE